MITRPNFNKLISLNPQFPLEEQRFNHDAIAIYLHEKNKRVWKNRPVYLVAGSEDLRDLLTRLPLQFDGEEAFIFYRSHTHAIVISLLRLNGKLITYFYDPQAWGRQNYPTRLAYDVLIKTYPGIEIYVSQAEVQSKYSQRGCTEHALDCFEYLLKVDCNWMAMLPSLRTTSDGESLLLLDKNVYPQVLKHHHANPSHARNQDDLEKWLAEDYLNEENELDWFAVERVVRLMQGPELPQWLFDGPKLYSTEVDLQAATIKLTFTHKDYVHANCLIYTEKIFPDHTSSATVLRESVDVRVYDDRNAKSLTFRAGSVEKLVTEFSELLRKPGRYELCHMRQSQGLAAFAKDMLSAIKMERELMAVMNSTKGGMDPRQVQLAMQFIFRNDQATIYVPHFVELSGENTTIDLPALKQRGFKTIVSTLPVDNEHQIALLIDLTETPFNVSIFNSSHYYYSESFLQSRLSKLFGDNITIKSVSPHFRKQTINDIWACGVHVIANIEAELGRRACAANEVLDVKVLARTYLRAWHYQQEEDEKQWNYRNTCIAFNEELHKTVQSSDGYSSGSLLKFLSGYVGTSHTELRRATPIALLLREYEKSNGSDIFGVTVLRFCNLVFPRLEKRELSRIFSIGENPPFTKGLYEHATKKYDTSWSYGGRSDLTDQIFDAVLVDLQLLVKQQTHPLEYLRTAVTKLLSDKEPAKVIKGFFKLIDCDYSIVDLNNKERFIALMILEICSQAAKYDGVVLGEKRNIQIERTAKDVRVKNLLTQLGIYQGEITPEVSELLQLPENLIVNITTKLHLAILSVLPDVPARMITIKGFLRYATEIKQSVFILLDYVDLSHRVAAANAVLTSVSAEELVMLENRNAGDSDDEGSGDDNDDETITERLYAYVLSEQLRTDASGNAYKILLNQIREWQAAGIKLTLNILDTFKNRFKSDELRELIETLVGKKWDTNLLRRYLHYLDRDEYFAAVSNVVWSFPEATLMINAIRNEVYGFTDNEILLLLAGYKGKILPEQMIILFNMHSTSVTRNHKLAAWLFENHPNLIDLQHFISLSAVDALVPLSEQRNEKLACLIAAWDKSNAPVSGMVGRFCDLLQTRHFMSLYASELRLHADILYYVKSLPSGEQAAVVMRYQPPASAEQLKTILIFLNADQIEAYVRQYLDKFSSWEVVFTIIDALKNKAYVLEVIKAKAALFKGVPTCTCGSSCCYHRRISASTRTLPLLSRSDWRYEAMVALVPAHEDMTELLASLKKLDFDDALKILTIQNPQIAELVKQTKVDFVYAIKEIYSPLESRKFIEMYLPYFNRDNIFDALSIHRAFTEASLKRGKPFLKEFSALSDILTEVNLQNRYLVLQRNVGLLTSIKEVAKVLKRLDEADAERFLCDYEDLIVGFYKKFKNTSFKKLFRLSVFNKSAALCKRYMKHVETGEETYHLLKSACLSNDDRMAMLLQAQPTAVEIALSNIVKFMVVHRDMLKFLRLFPDTLQSLSGRKLKDFAVKVHDDDQLAFMQELIELKANLTIDDAITIVSLSHTRHRFKLAAMLFTLSGDRRWKLFDYMPDEQSRVSLTKIMIKTPDDLAVYAIVCSFNSAMPAIVLANAHLITSQNMVALMRLSNELSVYIRENKLSLVTTPYLLVEVLNQIPQANRFAISMKFVTNFEWLVAVMSCLDKDEAEKALQLHADKITSDCDISQCLMYLNPESRLKIATQYSHCIMTQQKFENVLEYLVGQDRLTYLQQTKFRPAIGKWLQLLLPLDRYIYLCNRSVKENELYDAVATLVPELRLVYACEKMSLIKSVDIFKKIRSLFSEENGVMLDLHWKRCEKKEEDRKNSFLIGLFANERKGGEAKKHERKTKNSP